MAENFVRETHRGDKCAHRSLVQWTEAGPVGTFGHLAPKPVNSGRKFEREIAPSRGLSMAEKRVQEQQWKSECATLIYVQWMVAGLTGAAGQIVA